jgi:hypothetical protein
VEILAEAKGAAKVGERGANNGEMSMSSNDNLKAHVN